MPCLSILSNCNGVLLDEDWGIFKVGFNETIQKIVKTDQRRDP